MLLKLRASPFFWSSGEPACMSHFEEKNHFVFLIWGTWLIQTSGVLTRYGSYLMQNTSGLWTNCYKFKIFVQNLLSYGYNQEYAAKYVSSGIIVTLPVFFSVSFRSALFSFVSSRRLLAIWPFRVTSIIVEGVLLGALCFTKMTKTPLSSFPDGAYSPVGGGESKQGEGIRKS